MFVRVQGELIVSVFFYINLGMWKIRKGRWCVVLIVFEILMVRKYKDKRDTTKEYQTHSRCDRFEYNRTRRLRCLSPPRAI